MLTLWKWLRAEILGAFFNAVFLIALCLSIVLEAITRLIDPPIISNPKLILIVGSLGLLSNLVGFFVLGGHGHDHGDEGHSHSHDELHAAEEGHSHSHSHNGHSHTHDTADESGHPGAVLPEAAVQKAHTPDSSALGKTGTKNSNRRNHRRSSSIRSGNRLSEEIANISIHPASFRQGIIAASKPSLDGIMSEGSIESDDEVVIDENVDGPTETSPLLAQSNGKQNHGHPHKYAHLRPRHDSWHAEHNHNKPRKPASGGHSHNHADMGMNAMILHVIGDALGNVGVIVAALIIWLTDSPARFYADPAVSLFITLIILRSTIPLTSATAKILLQATPDHIDVNDIKEDIQDIPGVVSCHHVHIWQLSDSQIVASMHIQVTFSLSETGGSERYMDLAKQARTCLHAYGIHSATIQPEFCLDKDHDHGDDSGLALDGPGLSRKGSKLDDADSCLLECVDECEGSGCCPAPKSDTEHDHDHDHDHDHEDHAH
jgi:zinc transporter 1